MSEADEYGPGGARESGPQSEDALRDPSFVDCPDCGQPWTPSTEPRCPSCSLSWEDVETAADFLDRAMIEAA